MNSKRKAETWKKNRRQLVSSQGELSSLFWNPIGWFVFGFIFQFFIYFGASPNCSGSLLVGLERPNVVLRIEPGWDVYKASTFAFGLFYYFSSLFVVFVCFTFLAIPDHAQGWFLDLCSESLLAGLRGPNGVEGIEPRYHVSLWTLCPAPTRFFLVISCSHSCSNDNAPGWCYVLSVLVTLSCLKWNTDFFLNTYFDVTI